MKEIINIDRPFDFIGVAVLHAKEIISTSDYFFETDMTDSLHELITNHPIDDINLF